MIGISLALVYVPLINEPVSPRLTFLSLRSPILAYAQHRIFSHPFSRKLETSTDLDSRNLDPAYKKEGLASSGDSIGASSRFSL